MSSESLDGVSAPPPAAENPGQQAARPFWVETRSQRLDPLLKIPAVDQIHHLDAVRLQAEQQPVVDAHPRAQGFPAAPARP